MDVAIIDDDAAVLDSLRMILVRRGLDVACFTSANEFLARKQSMSVRCVVSDVRMPGVSGLDLQAELMRQGSAIPLILITGHGDIRMAVDAIKLGAFDFIEKPFDPERLADVVHRALVSGQQRPQQADLAAAAKRAAELPHRQRQVMDLVVQGLSNKEIALRLGISSRTVENYRAWVMERMGAPNLASLVRIVVLLEARGDWPLAEPAGTPDEPEKLR